jgi:hypothetical protein
MEQNKKHIYIAGKVENGKKSIQSLATDLEERGHIITYKWWEKDIKKPYLSKENVDDSMVASNEMENGVRQSDVFILIPDPNILGAGIEFGIALGDTGEREILVILDKDTRQSVFYANPKVICLKSLGAICSCNWF